MKIALYSPYLPKHFGGGEKHILTSAWYLSQTHSVTLLLPEVTAQTHQAISEYEKMFDLKLSQVKLKESGIAKRTNNAFQNWKETLSYDAILYLTDGSFFFSGSKKNILHIQVPYTNKLSFLQQCKLMTWNVRNANSLFTKKVVEKAWGTSIPFLHYPYADTARIPFSASAPRKKQILSVGRFIDPGHADLHSKRQDALIDAFIEGCQKLDWAKKGWELVLVGAVEPDGVHRQFVEYLRSRAQGYPVHFAHNVDHESLATFYKESDLYWHAAGLEIDEVKQPAKVEHFGMAPLEAMAYGAMAVVTNKGGLKEVIGNTESSAHLFLSTSELVEKTQNLMSLTASEKKSVRERMRRQAATFSLERFCLTLDTMLGLT